VVTDGTVWEDDFTSLVRRGDLEIQWYYSGGSTYCTSIINPGNVFRAFFFFFPYFLVLMLNDKTPVSFCSRHGHRSVSNGSYAVLKLTHNIRKAIKHKNACHLLTTEAIGLSAFGDAITNADDYMGGNTNTGLDFGDRTPLLS
jgi:hypothetical protein